MEEFIVFLQSLPPVLVYLVVFAVALIENIFPPFPSDLIIVFSGSLVGLGKVGFIPTVLFASAGSVLGFVTMYKLGEWFGRKILEQGKLRFLPRDGLLKVEKWFERHGYWVIIANRFLSGTRAVVSFVAGLSRINLKITVFLSFASALVWNTLLIGFGTVLGKNWEKVGFYLSTYSQIVTAILVVIAVIVIVHTLRANNKPGPT